MIIAVVLNRNTNNFIVQIGNPDMGIGGGGGNVDRDWMFIAVDNS
jgi:hypothetical protein